MRRLTVPPRQGYLIEWMTCTTGRFYALSVLAILCCLVVGGVVYLWTVPPQK